MINQKVIKMVVINGKGSWQGRKGKRTADFINILFYIILTFKLYTNLKMKNKLRQINLIVHQSDMTTKRIKRFFKVSSKQSALILYS